MALIYKWRVWCTTDSQYEYVWDPAEPTVCPANGAHGIDTAKSSIMQSAGDEAPTTSDGKPIVTANVFPGWCVETVVGAGDDVGAGTVGTGTKFQLSEDQTDTDEVLEYQFTCPVYIAAGGGFFKNAQLGDHASMEVYGPATTTTPNAGSGNCNLVKVQQLTPWDSGTAYTAGDLVTESNVNYVCTTGHTNQAPPDAGYWANTLNVITPAAGDGSHDIDYSQAVLIPSPDVTGYYDWDSPNTGRGTTTVSGTPGAALYNLFDFDVNIARFAGSIPLLGDGQAHFGVQNIKSKKLLPHWKNRVTLHNEGGSHTVEFVFHMVLGRATTI